MAAMAHIFMQFLAHLCVKEITYLHSVVELDPTGNPTRCNIVKGSTPPPVQNMDALLAYPLRNPV